jgi:hypothetical protein
MRIDSSGKILLNRSTYNFIGTNTSDAADNQRMILAGGGEASPSRGAQLQLYGNEYTGQGGNASLITGGTGYITFLTGSTITERMRITSGGNVGIGTISPNEKLVVWNATVADDVSGIRNSAYRPHLTLEDLSTNANDWQVWADGGVLSFLTGDVSAVNKLTTERMRIASNGDVGIGDTSPSYKLDVDGTIRATGDVIAYSDKRVKENIKTIDNSLEKVNQLRGVEFNKIGEDKKSIGVIAQEIEKILPEVVREDDKGMKSVAYGNITGILIEAIKELKAEVEELKKQIK